MTDEQFIEHNERMIALINKSYRAHNKELQKLVETLDDVIQSQAALYETLNEVKDELQNKL